MTENRTKVETDDRSAAPADRFPIVGVGASAGGLEAFQELLRALPADTGMGFVLVQHLDPVHESVLTQLLARSSSMPVYEVTQNMHVEPNTVYVIPPNAQMAIVGGVLKLTPRGKVRGAARSIDFFFEALAQDQRERAIGVVLSGTASDLTSCFIVSARWLKKTTTSPSLTVATGTSADSSITIGAMNSSEIPRKNELRIAVKASRERSPSPSASIV